MNTQPAHDGPTPRALGPFPLPEPPNAAAPPGPGLYRLYERNASIASSPTSPFRLAYIGLIGPDKHVPWRYGLHCNNQRRLWPVEQQWWQHIVSYTLQPFPSRNAAAVAERLAIVAEKPAYNRTRYDRPPPSSGAKQMSAWRIERSLREAYQQQAVRQGCTETSLVIAALQHYRTTFRF
jgi:hypothetical protein